MQPQTQEPSTGQTSNGLDPKVVKVMRAIRSVETGGHPDQYNAIGDKGASRGAYQWYNNGKVLKAGELPANWKSDAKQFLGDENAEMSPANQNKLVYTKIKSQKEQGLQPDEIAAKWNGARLDKASGKYTYINPEYGNKFRAALGAAPRRDSDTQTRPQEGGKSVGGFIGNVASSGAGLIGGLFNAIRHPIDTVTNIGKIGAGAVEKLIPGEQGQEKYADAVGQFYKERYGGLSNIGETLYKDPVGAAADASMLLSGGGAALSKLGKVSEATKLADLLKGTRLAKGGMEAEMIAKGVEGSSLASKAGAAASRAGNAVNPLAIPGKAMGKMGELLKSSSVKSYEDALAATTNADKFLTKPITQGREIVLPSGEKFRVPGLIERGVTGSYEGLSNTAKQGRLNAGKLIGEAEAKIPEGTTLKVKPILDDITEAKRAFTIKGPKGNVIVDKAAVKNLEDFSQKVRDLSSKGLISNESATELKRIWADTVAASGKYYGKTITEGSKVNMMDVATKAVRRQLDTKFPEIAKINAEYKFWKDAEKVINDTAKRKIGQSGVVRKVGWSAVGAILGSPGGIATSAVGAIALEALQVLMNSPRWQTISSIVKDRIASAIVRGDAMKLNKIIKSIGVPISQQNRALEE